MKIAYNAPVILNFTLISVLVLIINALFDGFKGLFMVHSFSYDVPINYFQLFSHVAGHADWNHLLGNFSFILLLGPLVEEKYGSKNLLFMILATGFFTGILHILFFNAALLGASGIVFMLIILSSMSGMHGNRIPLTFVLIVILYLGKEFVNLFEENQISEFAHIIGGLMGSVFGFLLNKPKKTNLPLESES